MRRQTFTDPTLAKLANDIYNRKVDGMQTRGIAEAYGISMNLAFRSLNKIVYGGVYSEDFPFGEFDEDMGGVRIQDGSTFTHGDDAEYSEGRTGSANHLVWFCN
jgi:hypothetical protein